MDPLHFIFSLWMSHPQAIGMLPTLFFIGLMLLAGMGVEKLRCRLASSTTDSEMTCAKSAFV
jgi:hypothetical protein